MPIQIGSIFETSDYEMFKIVNYNREVTNQRAKKIITSIKKHGYILNPICVNEHFEVIDGQGRLEALRTLGMKVHYYIEPGAGKDECIALNSYNSLWTMYDYICSFANDGNDDYRRFKLLYDDHKVFGLDTVYFAATNVTTVQHNAIKSGAVTITPDQYLAADAKLKALHDFIPGVSRIKGNQKKVYSAIIFALGCEGVKAEKLKERIELKYGDIPNISTVDQALQALSDIYNYHSKEERVYLHVKYDQFLRGKYKWYGAMWGDKK